MTTVFVTDANNREVLEYDGATGTILRWYAYGLGANDVLNQMNVAANTRTTFIPDLQGSMIGTMDSVSGTLTKRGYLPYGGSASVIGTFAYTGQRIDPETGGLHYYRARMYAPKWRRFMQVDPLGYSGGTNLYAYVGNDPLNATDPTGLWSPAAHDALLQHAFGARLLAPDIRILQQSSRQFDRATQGFGANMAPLHSMRAVNQTPEAAIAARDAFIDRTISQAQQLAQGGDRPAALRLLGQALHPIMDSSSPIHTTPDGQPRLWAPWSFQEHSPADCMLCGSERVQDITPAIFDQQHRALNAAYDRVFGPAK